MNDVRYVYFIGMWCAKKKLRRMNSRFDTQYLMKSVAEGCNGVLKKRVEEFSDAVTYFDLIESYSHLTNDDVLKVPFILLLSFIHPHL